MIPSISIIIPVYNVAQYVGECLQSVARQDYSGPIECIVIDDCSSDSSLQVVREFVAAYTGDVRFVVLQQARRQMQSAARNRGLRQAQGEYIYYLDADDWLHPATLSVMVAALARHPDSQLVQAGVATTQPGVFAWLDCATWSDTQREYCADHDWIVDTCARHCGMIPMTPVSKLLSRSFLMEHRLMFREGIYYEDDLWQVMLSMHLQRVAFVHQNLYHYRIRPDSTVGGGRRVYPQYRRLVWNEIMDLLGPGFHPQSVLSQIECDTTDFLTQHRSWSVWRMVLGIKWRLLTLSPWRYRLIIVRRLARSLLR